MKQSNHLLGNKYRSLVLSLSGLCLIMTGCATTKPEQEISIIVPTELAAPPTTYMTQSLDTKKSEMNAKQWLALAELNYKNKKYARALRAANEALKINDQSIEANQIAMLAAVKVTEANIDSYHDNSLMNQDDKTEFKSTLTELTTIINTSE